MTRPEELDACSRRLRAAFAAVHRCRAMRASCGSSTAGSTPGQASDLFSVGMERQDLLRSLSHIAEDEWRARFMGDNPLLAPKGFGVAA